MDLGNKIKSLRLKAGLTQEMLASVLGVSFQTISKWENNVCAPDIEMLPRISIYFGISIDELFDLTADDKICRIEKMLDFEQELPNKTFDEYVEFLHSQLSTTTSKAKIYGLLARLYHHRMNSDSFKVSLYTKKALKLDPRKSYQWLLQKAEGAVARDWNIKNHHEIIDFYKQLIHDYPNELYNYLELMDHLIVDYRVEEAREILGYYKNHKNSEEYRSLYYEFKIAHVLNDSTKMNEVMNVMKDKYSQHGNAMFLLGNMYAERLEYENAIHYFDLSFKLDKQNNNQLYTDALEAMAILYKLMEKYDKAMECYDRILEVLEEYYGIIEGDPVEEIRAKKASLANII